MSLDLTTLVRQLQEIETRHPDTAADLDPIIKALSSAEENTIGVEEAFKILGLRSVDTVERWVELGILAGWRDKRSGRWQIPLAEVLRLRGMHQALSEVGGEDLTEEELETLAATRPGTFPWNRVHHSR